MGESKEREDSPMSKTTQELVQLASQGNQEAISELYEQTYSSVYQAVRILIRDEDTALDIVQESYVKGFNSLDQLKEPEKFSAWMKHIASNRAKDYLKKKRPTLFTELENEDGEEIDFADDCTDHLPEVVLDRAETARLIKEILDTLPQEQRAAISMYYYEEMSIQEIAQALNCSENTVKSRLKYAREKIKAKVEDLAKKGTKLYSLAPMPYLLWLLQMAKVQKIPASTISSAVDTVADFTASTVASQTVAHAADAEAVTETAKTAAKTAAKAGAKSLSKRIVAGTLAVTVAGGAGVAAVNALNSGEKENAAAHVVYEEFLGRYKTALEAEYDVILADQDRFWSEISEDIWEQNPDVNMDFYNSWDLDYVSGEDFQEGIPVPDTLYDPNMDMQWLLTYYRQNTDIQYAYLDADEDGVDELLIGRFYNGQLQTDKMDVYAVKNGRLIRGMVDFQFDGTQTAWELKPTQEAEYVEHNDIVNIHMGKEAFSPSIVIEEPNCDWQTFCNYSGKTP